MPAIDVLELVHADTTISVRAPVPDALAQRLHDRLIKEVPDVLYQEEQHGATLIVHIRCKPFDETAVRRLFRELGIVPFGDGAEDD